MRGIESPSDETAVPNELLLALKRAGAQVAFAGLSAAERQEHLTWVANARNADVRLRRAAKIATALAGEPFTEERDAL